MCLLRSAEPISVTSLAQRIFVSREKLGLSQAKLAVKVGMSQQWVAKLETGDMLPSADRAMRLAEVLGIDLEWMLVGGNDEQCVSEATEG